jgi:hypothetical protein
MRYTVAYFTEFKWQLVTYSNVEVLINESVQNFIQSHIFTSKLRPKNPD